MHCLIVQLELCDDFDVVDNIIHTILKMPMIYKLLKCTIGMSYLDFCYETCIQRLRSYQLTYQTCLIPIGRCSNAYFTDTIIHIILY